MTDLASTHPARRRISRLAAQLAPRRVSAGYLAILFIVVFGLARPDTFLTEVTFRVVFAQGVVTCVLALAFLVPLIGGSYDLSIGAIMSLALGINVYLSIESDLSPGVTSCLVVLLGVGIGAVNGFVIVKLRVNSFIATLGVSQVLFAGAIWLTGNRQLVADFDDSWRTLGGTYVAGVPIVFLYLIGIAVVLWYVLQFTRTGRYLIATGGNPDAAHLAGVRTDRMIWGSFIASGGIASVAGVIYSMNNGVYSTSVGPGYLFPAVAAVFLGASQFAQRPNVWGTLIAYFALALGVYGLALTFSGAALWSQPLFQGVSLIVAVAVASRPVRRRLRRQTGSEETTNREQMSADAGAPS